MKKNKSVRFLLKKRLSPFLSYAALIGVGAIAVSATGTLVGNDTGALPPPDVVAPAHHVTKLAAAPVDLDKLKIAAGEFATQLSIIKLQVAELEKYGRVPSPALMQAIDNGDRLVASIVAAQTPSDIDEPDPAAALQTIGAAIAANSKF